MNEFPHHFDAPEDAYFGFFRADSAKNAKAWAAVMHYPHVRIPARTGSRLYYCDTAEEYAARADWTAREATGWVLSRGMEPVRLHESANKVHLLGGWTRYNADDEPILSNRVTYILTKIGQSWGIQARFSADTFTGSDDGKAAAAAIAVSREYVAALQRNDVEAAAQLCRYPFLEIGIGEVKRAEDATEMGQLLDTKPRRKVVATEAQAAQSGTNGATVALATAYEEGNTEHTLLIVGKEEAAWRVAGVSTIASQG